MNWQDTISAAVTLFFIMDPLGNMPIFNSVLARFDSTRRAKIVARELIIALVILFGFLFAGESILSFMGIGESTLSIAGGFLLFIISLKMIFPKPVSAEESSVEDPFIVPLAMPLVAGPSTIAVLLLLSSSQPDAMLQWSAALFFAWLGTTVLLVASPFVMRFLGERGAKAMERLMGMILVMLATQMLLNGVKEFIQTL